MEVLLLAAASLVALSVSKLEAELSAKPYPTEVLAEALILELDKDEPRKTAIEALEGAVEALEEDTYTVPKGRAMTTLAGMKKAGDVITADMVSGGEDTLKALKAKGHLA